MTGERIKEIRMDLGLTMEEFAKRIDDKAKSGTVSNWETGKNLPNNNRLKKIAELGNVDISYLLGDAKMADISFYKQKNKFLLDRTFDLLMLMPTKQQAEILQEMRKCLEKESE